MDQSQYIKSFGFLLKVKPDANADIKMQAQRFYRMPAVQVQDRMIDASQSSALFTESAASFIGSDQETVLVDNED